MSRKPVHNFEVGLKAFLNKDGYFLGLKDAYSEFWDIPGGHTTPAEINLPVNECLRRELLEKLGLNIQFEIKNLFEVFKFRVNRGNKLTPNINLFLVFYNCRFAGGEIVLNKESLKYEWLDKESYRQYNFGAYQKVVDQYVVQKLQS